MHQSLSLSGQVAHGLISNYVQSDSLNKVYKFLIYVLASSAISCNFKSLTTLLSYSSLNPLSKSNGIFQILSGYSLATFSISTPPSVEKINAGLYEFLSKINAK